jgi:hypothetical protein
MRPLISSLSICCVLAAGLGCEESCDAGEEWCDGDRIMVCVDGESEDWDEEDDDGLFELIDLALPDNYGALKRDCADDGKTCTMRVDSVGREYGHCWYDQTL